MGLFNVSTMLGSVMLNSVGTTTGSIVVTLLIIVFAVLMFLALFGVPLEYSLILLLPLLLGSAAYEALMLPALIVAFILLAVVVVKNWIT